jgi:DNA-binding response OmpR family regulator
MNQKQPQQQGQQRILVVDDEPDLTKLCSLALEYHGLRYIHLTIRKKHCQTISQVTTI